MLDPTMLAMLAKEYQNRMLEEAKRYRMLKATRAARPRLQQRLLMRFGDFLISAGLRLKERYKPAMCPGLSRSWSLSVRPLGERVSSQPPHCRQRRTPR